MSAHARYSIRRFQTATANAISTIAVLSALGACSAADGSSTATTPTVAAPTTEPVSVASANAPQQATVGVAFSYDATLNGTSFKDPKGAGLTYAVSFAPSANGLTATAGRITGVPLVAGTITAAITATDALGKSATNAFTITVVNATAVALVSGNTPQGATVGGAFSYDATKGGTAFTGTALSYAVTFAPGANGLTATNGRISGAPTAAGITNATIIATDVGGNSVSNVFPIVAFSVDLAAPTLPATGYAYSDATSPLAAHFTIAVGGARGPGGSVIAADNTPTTNITTDAGAALGRVLFYDRRLSVNDRVSCASCHQQQFGFADTARLSRGFTGGSTGRHSMALQNARFYNRGRFFWDERAATLEAQVLAPIQDATEMGMTLSNVVTKLTLSAYYAPLFQAAFGTTDITSDRVSRALSQFVRSLVSSSAKFDRAFTNGPPNFAAVFTQQELLGQQLFNGPAKCAQCHETNAHIGDDIHNTGLDPAITDAGAGLGRFKTPSLRNVEKRGRFMHDGRFTTLEQVVEFYNSGVQNNGNLDNRLRGQGNQPQRLNLSQVEKDAIVAYMKTFTDDAFLNAQKFSNPFPR